jgi:hypothetical protein
VVSIPGADCPTLRGQQSSRCVGNVIEQSSVVVLVGVVQGLESNSGGLCCRRFYKTRHGLTFIQIPVTVLTLCGQHR